MLSYAGVDLLVPTPQLEEWVKRFLCYEQASPFQIFYNDLCNYFPQPFPNAGMIKLNSLFWPRDAGRWSFGFFLCTTTQLNRINAYLSPGGSGSGSGSGVSPAFTSSGSGGCLTCSGCGSTSSSGSSVGSAPLIINTDTNSSANSGVNCLMFMLPPKPIARVAEGRETSTINDSEGLWLITLVDERFFWNDRRPCCTNVSGATWDDIYLDFFSKVSGETLFSQSTSGLYGAMPSSLSSVEWQQNFAHLFDAYLYQTQKRLIKDINGSYSIISPQEGAIRSKYNAISPMAIIAGGGGRYSNLLPSGLDISSVAYLPHKECADLRFAIPKGISFITNNGMITNKYNPYCSPSYGDRLKFFSVSGSPPAEFYTNFANDWYYWRLSYLDFCAAGIVNYTMTGFEDFVEFHYSGSKSYTRIYRTPDNDLTGKLLNVLCSQPSASTACTGTVTSVQCTGNDLVVTYG